MDNDLEAHGGTTKGRGCSAHLSLPRHLLHTYIEREAIGRVCFGCEEIATYLYPIATCTISSLLSSLQTFTEWISPSSLLFDVFSPRLGNGKSPSYDCFISSGDQKEPQTTETEQESMNAVRISCRC